LGLFCSLWVIFKPVVALEEAEREGFGAAR
jgi:hypothetical protein